MSFPLNDDSVALTAQLYVSWLNGARAVWSTLDRIVTVHISDPCARELPQV